MKLNKKAFDILVDIEAGIKVLNDDIPQILFTEGLINETGSINENGLNYLEPFRVKKAIFMAAGFGSRLVPLTLELPKPLIKVNGRRIIDASLDAIIALGIEDITLIRGYKKECMDELLADYPMIKFIDNDDYDKANNISSAAFVKDDLAQSYVLESDLVLYNQSILKKYARESFYIAIPVEETDDWCFEVEAGLIKDVGIGGVNTHQMVGISYWNEVDAKQLSADIGDFYADDANKNRFWDEVSLVDYKENYDVHVNEVNLSDIIEIDTYDELKVIDPSYI